jgi:hypothetical protein
MGIEPNDMTPDHHPASRDKSAPSDSLDTLRTSVEAITWTKTTYIRPHEYFLRDDHPDVYGPLRQAIVEHGYDAYFYRAPFRYLDLGEYKYWAYDTLINRERLDLVHPSKAHSETHRESGGAECDR